MGKAWDWVTEHPWIAAGIIFAIGVLLVLMFMPKSQAAPVDNTGAALAAGAAAATASGNELASMQLQGQVASHAIDAQVKATDIDAASSLALAQLHSADVTSANNTAVAMANTVTDQTGLTTSRDVQVSTIAAQSAAAVAGYAYQQASFNTLAASNVATTNSTFDFLSGLTARNTALATTPFQSTKGSVNFTHDATGNVDSLSFGIENNEFPATGPTPTQLITALYQGDLGRAPDPGGLNYYLAQLASGNLTLGGINATLLNSPEHQSMVGHP